MGNDIFRKAIYAVAGVSRQAYHQQIRQSKKVKNRDDLIVEKVIKFRKRHSRMGSRILFYALKIEGVGVNTFESLLSSRGLSAKYKRKRIVTTTGVYEDTDVNLISGLKISDINQVIAGDITYFKSGVKLFYIFTLKDTYSKRIVGLYGSDNMLAINAVKTLRQVITLRKKASLCNTIHHSDAGTQYKSGMYKALLKSCEIKMSIADNCLQNGMAEQLNDIVKNYYLINEKITTVNGLNKALCRIKKIINEQRPVKALGYRTPVEYERWIAGLALSQRPVRTLYDFAENQGAKNGSFKKA